MQILTSGSFINFDNGEKIEQLIFTAKAIADSAVQTEGFTSSEENNKRLALEIWQGAEYLTREHERARIQNLFVGNFLERLREIAPAPAKASIALPETARSPTAENSSVESDAPKDEFLGFVTGGSENEVQEIAARNEPVVENAEAMESVETFPLSDELSASDQAENLEPENAESFESLRGETVEPESDKTIEPKQETEMSVAEVSQTAEAEKPAVRKITLPEKEPYRFDDCTVTATIQLLPVESGIRRAVLSVRTHDFAPQISVVELRGSATAPENYTPALVSAFEKYKADLPVKVMDKMKREKSAVKKQQSKTAHDAKTSSPDSNPPAAKPLQAAPKTVQTSGSKSEVNQTATTAAAPSITQSAASQAAAANRNTTSAKTKKPQDSAQGNLFGF